MPFPNPATQFRPGQSGNPGGRPAGRSIKARLRELLDRTDFSGKPLPAGKQIADLLSEVILKGALEGDFRFCQFLVENVESSNEIEEIWQRLESLGKSGGDLVGDRAAGDQPGPDGSVGEQPV